MNSLLAESVREANTVLSSMRDKGARWWNFSVSHTTFNMVIGDPLGQDNIVLCLPGCGYLAGPVQWPNQRIEVEIVEDSTVIQDHSVGFRALGGGLKWRKNYDVWSFCGIWDGRGEGSLEIDAMTLKLRKALSHYYEGEIGFAHLSVMIDTLLWYGLPAAGSGKKPSDPI